MKQDKFNDVLNIVLLVFLIVQPFFDIYMAMVGEKLDILSFSIVTLIRTLGTTALLIFTLIYQFKYKIKIKLVYVLLAYFGLVIVYLVGHHYNITLTKSYYATNMLYNFFTEVMYVLRLIIPVVIMYIVVVIKPHKKNIEDAITCVIFIVSIVIIVTNLLGISIASYSTINNKIEYNFIDWFKYDSLSYKETLSKGFFVSANQIGALLVVLMPFLLYRAVKNNKWYLYLILFLQIIAMILVGTRVANYGWMLICLTLFSLYTAFIIFKINKKFEIKSILILSVIVILGVILYMKSPARNRTFAYMYEGEEITLEGANENYITPDEFDKIIKDKKLTAKYLKTKTVNDSNLYNAKCKYIENSYKGNFITDKYIYKIYPYNEDPDFWVELFKESVAIKGDSRKRQIAIVKRIKQNNNNFTLDTLFGLGATPMNNREFMIENDLISHYYNLGVLGILLFMLPYVISVLYALYLNRKSILKLFNIHFLVYCMSLFLTYVVGYFAGHVLDEYIVTIYFATISGLIINYYRKDESIYETSKT